MMHISPAFPKYCTSHKTLFLGLGFATMAPVISTPVISTPVVSPPVVSTPVFIPYHLFLTCPINNIIPRSFETLPPTVHANHLRDKLAIDHPEVYDLDFSDLWRTISEAFDTFHDIANCNCCSGKAPDSNGGRSFVLAICGDLRGRSPRNQSWSL
jgi:hypothetical protein